MDTTSLWNKMCTALRAQKIEVAGILAAALLYQMDAGRSPPQLMEPEVLDEAARSKIVRYFCRSVVVRSGGDA